MANPRPATARVSTTRLRRARIGVALLFLTNGALFANLLPRYPSIKSELDLSNAQFGLAVAAFPLGALVAGLGAAALIRRFGSGAVAVAGTMLTGAGILAAGLAPSWALLAGALLGAGAADSGALAEAMLAQHTWCRGIVTELDHDLPRDG